MKSETGGNEELVAVAESLLVGKGGEEGVCGMTIPGGILGALFAFGVKIGGAIDEGGTVVIGGSVVVIGGVIDVVVVVIGLLKLFGNVLLLQASCNKLLLLSPPFLASSNSTCAVVCKPIATS